LAAAEASGAQAIHPGYGFLSESAMFAQRVSEAGLVFVGPRAETIRMMGDKISAKNAMLKAGVPCVPGSDSALTADALSWSRSAMEIGYPIIIKAAGGGGGRGMRVVESEENLASAVITTQEEARRAFGNPEVYMEKYLQTPRHIEIQVLSDQFGNAIWLGDRDCSMQRRHQKILEEAPAFGIDRAAIEKVGNRCVEACRTVGYVGAGTFEFLFESGNFYFIEMNTRVQVEHPVTELVTGIDIVRQQILIAAGEKLEYCQSDVHVVGAAIECRINAENPTDFLPSPGLIDNWVMPGGMGIRVDTHAYSGYRVSPYYDSLVGKVMAYGTNREHAISRMRSALTEMSITGIATNIPLHRWLLGEPHFLEGGASIHYLEHAHALQIANSGAPGGSLPFGGIGGHEDGRTRDATNPPASGISSER
uniref:ATP-binding protein n=1 Tax=uncultured Caballeronia sp. TaxID=1827198 RepID=UPI0035CB14B6